MVLFFWTFQASINFCSGLRNPHANISNLCQCDVSNFIPAIGISKTRCRISGIKCCYLHIMLTWMSLTSCHSYLLNCVVFVNQYLERVTIKSVNLRYSLEVWRLRSPWMHLKHVIKLQSYFSQKTELFVTCKIHYLLSPLLSDFYLRLVKCKI